MRMEGVECHYSELGLDSVDSGNLRTSQLGVNLVDMYLMMSWRRMRGHGP